MLNIAARAITIKGQITLNNLFHFHIAIYNLEPRFWFRLERVPGRVCLELVRLLLVADGVVLDRVGQLVPAVPRRKALGKKCVEYYCFPKY
jgi:hypothetical protein